MVDQFTQNAQRDLPENVVTSSNDSVLWDAFSIIVSLFAAYFAYRANQLAGRAQQESAALESRITAASVALHRHNSDCADPIHAHLHELMMKLDLLQNEPDALALKDSLIAYRTRANELLADIKERMRSLTTTGGISEEAFSRMFHEDTYDSMRDFMSGAAGSSDPTSQKRLLKRLYKSLDQFASLVRESVNTAALKIVSTVQGSSAEVADKKK